MNQEFDKLREKAFKRYAPPPDIWNPVDKALFNEKHIFGIEESKAKDLRFKAIKHSFNYHYLNSNFYNKYCKYLEIKPDDIKTEKDFTKIPLISDLLFKDHPDAGKDFIEWLAKIFEGKIANINDFKKLKTYEEIIDYLQKLDITMVFSSGTSGTFSFVPRDKTTWDRQMYVCSRIFELADYQFQSPESTIVWLGPDPRRTHLYIGRLTKMLTDLFDEKKLYFGIKNELTPELIRLLMRTDKSLVGRLKSKFIRPIVAVEQSKMLDRVIEVLKSIKSSEAEIGIGGTPFFIEMLMSRIKEKDLSFDFNNGVIVTAGGWKVFSDIEIPTDRFRKKVQHILGIQLENIRDIYGMVECNALCVSCEGHYKHVPNSVLYPMVLDEESEPLGFDEFGRFAFLDPLANSYPGFIMTGDRVKILEKCPVCDRPGPVICEDISRMSGIQDRGCGATLAKMFSEEISKVSEK